jgi:hypothetical protein
MKRLVYIILFIFSIHIISCGVKKPPLPPVKNKKDLEEKEQENRSSENDQTGIH